MTSFTGAGLAAAKVAKKKNAAVRAKVGFIVSDVVVVENLCKVGMIGVFGIEVCGCFLAAVFS